MATLSCRQNKHLCANLNQSWRRGGKRVNENAGLYKRGSDHCGNSLLRCPRFLEVCPYYILILSLSRKEIISLTLVLVVLIATVCVTVASVGDGGAGISR